MPAHTPAIIALLLIRFILSRLGKGGLNLDHFKVFFAGPAIRAEPVNRHIFPAGAGRQALFRAAFFFFVHPTADDTHPDSVRFAIGGLQIVLWVAQLSYPVFKERVVCHAKSNNQAKGTLK